MGVGWQHGLGGAPASRRRRSARRRCRQAHGEIAIDEALTKSFHAKFSRRIECSGKPNRAKLAVAAGVERSSFSHGGRFGQRSLPLKRLSRKAPLPLRHPKRRKPNYRNGQADRQHVDAADARDGEKVRRVVGIRRWRIRQCGKRPPGQFRPSEHQRRDSGKSPPQASPAMEYQGHEAGEQRTRCSRGSAESLLCPAGQTSYALNECLQALRGKACGCEGPCHSA